MPTDFTRRDVLGSSLATASYLVLGQRLTITPAEAAEREFTPEVLPSAQINSIEAIAEQLVPGSVDAGIGAYLDAQLRAGEDSLLIGKYLGVDVSRQTEFYQTLAGNLQNALDTEQSTSELIAAMWSDTQTNWDGPPPSYMLFVLRADALDVTYGTPDGFKSLGIPYVAHIVPEQLW